jgi:hypothetical protein
MAMETGELNNTMTNVEIMLVLGPSEVKTLFHWSNHTKRGEPIKSHLVKDNITAQIEGTATNIIKKTNAGSKSK